MKLKHSVILLLALTGGKLATPASAQQPLAYTPDHLFLAFRTTGASTPASSDYLVDLGPASQFTSATLGSQSILSLGNIQADLSSLFGASWYTRSDLFWSISGTPGGSAVGSDPLRTLYASREEVTAGIQSDPWLRANSAAQAGPTNRFVSLGNAYAVDSGNPNQSTANSDVALIQSTSAANSYASFQASGSSFSYFSPTIEGDFGDGASGTVLDLYRLAPATGAAIGTGGDFVGSFGIDSSANVSFSAGTVVPEPTSAVLATVGLTFLGAMRRFRVPAQA